MNDVLDRCGKKAAELVKLGDGMARNEWFGAMALAVAQSLKHQCSGEDFEPALAWYIRVVTKVANTPDRVPDNWPGAPEAGGDKAAIKERALDMHRRYGHGHDALMAAAVFSATSIAAHAESREDAMDGAKAFARFVEGVLDQTFYAGFGGQMTDKAGAQ